MSFDYDEYDKKYKFKHKLIIHKNKLHKIENEISNSFNDKSNVSQLSERTLKVTERLTDEKFVYDVNENELRFIILIYINKKKNNY